MKILLLNIDSKLPNLALKKIEMWHKLRGNEITWDMPMMLGQTDLAYASCIFTKQRYMVENFRGLYPELIAGGTGWNLSTKLPLEIEGMKPRINYGFTTRGCIRRCPWCFVPIAEGNIKIVGDIYDIWDRRNKHITLLDNNILAIPEHFERICQQLAKEQLAVDFNQGLDIRLVTERTIPLLQKLRTKRLRFSFDLPELEPVIREKVKLLETVHREKFFYVLVGFNTTFEQDLHRLAVLKELGCRAYVMRHENTPKERRYIRLAEWANLFWAFVKYDFRTFCRVVKRDKDGDGVTFKEANNV